MECSNLPTLIVTPKIVGGYNRREQNVQIFKLINLLKAFTFFRPSPCSDHRLFQDLHLLRPFTLRPSPSIQTVTSYTPSPPTDRHLLRTVTFYRPSPFSRLSSSSTLHNVFSIIVLSFHLYVVF